MSRVGLKPIPVPADTKIELKPGWLFAVSASGGSPCVAICPEL